MQVRLIHLMVGEVLESCEQLKGEILADNSCGFLAKLPFRKARLANWKEIVIGAIFWVLLSIVVSTQLEIVHFMTVFHAMQKSIICKITAWHVTLFFGNNTHDEYFLLPGKKGLRLGFFDSFLLDKDDRIELLVEESTICYPWKIPCEKMK